MQPYLQLFLYLQLLDLLTTILGLRLGLEEGSPFVSRLMEAGPVAGAVFSKFLAFFIAGICLWIHRNHLIHWINYWYAALVVWNLSIMLVKFK